MIFIAVEFPVKPEHADEWPRPVADGRRRHRRLQGEARNLRFEWSRSLEDPNITCCSRTVVPRPT
jgi:quinol monooxygenase YgiN